MNIRDVPRSPTDTVALPTQKALGLIAQSDIAHAAPGAPSVSFVVLRRALDEATELANANQRQAWLAGHYHLISDDALNDLNVYLHGSS